MTVTSHTFSSFVIFRTNPSALKTIHVTGPSPAPSHHPAAWNDGGGGAFSVVTATRWRLTTALARPLEQSPSFLQILGQRMAAETEEF